MFLAKACLVLVLGSTMEPSQVDGEDACDELEREFELRVHINEVQRSYVTPRGPGPRGLGPRGTGGPGG